MTLARWAWCTTDPSGSAHSQAVDLPHGGDLSLWFQVVSLGGCMKYDSKSGGNYHFKISE